MGLDEIDECLRKFGSTDIALFPMSVHYRFGVIRAELD